MLYTTSCKHSLVLLRMGEIIARSMLSWLKLLIKLLLLHLVGCLYYCISDARSHEHQNHGCFFGNLSCRRKAEGKYVPEKWSVVKCLRAELVEIGNPVKWRLKNQTSGTWFSIVRFILIFTVMNKRHTTGSIQADHSVSNGSKVWRSVKTVHLPAWLCFNVLRFTRSGSSSRQFLGIHDHDQWTFVEYPVTLHWNHCRLFFFFWCDSPPWGQGLLIHEVSRSHTTTHPSR